MSKRFLVVALISLSSVHAGRAHSGDEFEKLLLEAKQRLTAAVNQWDEPGLLEARSLFERLLQNEKWQWLTHYYVGYADYNLAIYYQTRNKKDLALQYLDDGIAHVEAAVAARQDFADAHALLSSLLGQKIGMDPSLGTSLGPQAGTALAEALKYGPDNPRVALISALSAYFTPEAFGGSKTRAVQELERAIKLFESETLEDPRLPDWGHSDAWTWRARFHLDAGEVEQARKCLERALKVNPESAFARSTKKWLTK